MMLVEVRRSARAGEQAWRLYEKYGLLTEIEGKGTHLHAWCERASRQHWLALQKA